MWFWFEDKWNERKKCAEENCEFLSKTNNNEKKLDHISIIRLVFSVQYGYFVIDSHGVEYFVHFGTCFRILN